MDFDELPIKGDSYMRIMFLTQSPRTDTMEARHDRIQALLRSYASPGTDIDLHYPDDFAGAQVFEAMGDKNALSGLHHAIETPALIAKAVWAAQEGYDAVIQSNTFDPGVEASRLAVGIPVVGLLRTALHVGATLADRIGILVPLEGHVPYTRRLVRSYGMGDRIVGVRSLGIYGKELESDKPRILDKATELMQRLVEDDGSELLLPLGGALIPYVVDPLELQERVGVQVINTKAVGIGMAELYVRLGLTHSPLTYPQAELGHGAFVSSVLS